jgi:hypothetical protein
MDSFRRVKIVCGLLPLLAGLGPRAGGGVPPSATAAIAATATIVNPLGVAGEVAEMPLPVISELAAAQGSHGVIAVDTGMMLFYCPQPEDVIIRVESISARTKTLLLRASAGPEGYILRETGVPGALLMSPSAMAGSLPEGTGSCVVTIIPVAD